MPPLDGVPASFCIQYPMEMMFALVNGAPSEVRMASDQAFSFSPVGVSYSAVGCGVSPPASTDEDCAVEGAVVVGACVGVALACVGFGDPLWLGAGILAVAKPSGLALAWSSELPATDGTAASVAASRGLAELAVSGVGTAPTATAMPRPPGPRRYQRRLPARRGAVPGGGATREGGSTYPGHRASAPSQTPHRPAE